jgi:hypothetical protein
MRKKIIDWLKANGTPYKEDFIEVIFYIMNDSTKLMYDILTDELSVIEYDSKGNILDVEKLKTEKDYLYTIESFEI